jgi:tripartite-type tricarboxylate transporter receptor subunit TctC
MSLRCLIPLVLCALTLIAPAHAAERYPSKQVKIIVPYPPGGGTDVMARVLAKQLTAVTGESFYIENKAGADATLGAELAARSPNDGYTLLAVSGVPFVLNQVVFSKLPYNILDDFEPVSLFASGPLVLVVHPSFPADSAKEFVAHLKANPGRFNYAGSDQFTYLTMEMILLATGTKMTHVPYKGVGPSLNDVVGGHIPVMLSSLAPAMPFIQSKRVKALAVTSKQRSPALPDVPTIAETIVADYDVPAWYGVFAPRGTPRTVVDALNQAINRAVDSSEVQGHLATLGTDVVRTTPQEFGRFLRVELDKWRAVAKATNLPTK